MNFLSVQFLIFVLVISILYYVVPKKYRWIVILIANIIFYIMSSGVLSLFLLLSIISVYLSGLTFNKIKDKKGTLKELDDDTKKIQKKQLKKLKKMVLVLTLIFNIGILVELKYNNFIMNIFNSIAGDLTNPINFILPLGISYYTLEAISYIVDVYYEKYDVETNFFKLMLYLTFFPLMVEGPISRYNEIGPSLYEGHEFNYNKYKSGMVLILWGFMKKLVIADRLGLFVDKAFMTNTTSYITVLSIICYTIQIYIEFSGCMDIVKGVSELFGIKVVDNFKRPFLSTSVEEFWRKWHITLGTWLKDYIFYPISISKINLKLSMKVRKWKCKYIGNFIAIAFPLFFVWFLNGLWHGPTIKYVFYGLYYYSIMMIGLLIKPLNDKIINLFHIKTDAFSYKLLRIIRTDIIVVIGMTLFRAETLTSFVSIMKSVFITKTVSPLFSLGLRPSGFLIALGMNFVVLIVNYLVEKGIDVRNKLQEQNLYFEWGVYLILIFITLIFGMYGSGYDASSFIYGGF